MLFQLNGKSDLLLYIVDATNIQKQKIKTLLYMAAAKGHLETLKYLHDLKIKSGKENEQWTNHGKTLECIKFLNDNGYHMVARTSIKAAKRGDLESLKYIQEFLGQWTEEMMEAAAQGGSLECLQYLHENNCPRYLMILIFIFFYIYFLLSDIIKIVTQQSLKKQH